jgi:hypothetical protein
MSKHNTKWRVKSLKQYEEPAILNREQVLAAFKKLRSKFKLRSNASRLKKNRDSGA